MAAATLSSALLAASLVTSVPLDGGVPAVQVGVNWGLPPCGSSDESVSVSSTTHDLKLRIGVNRTFTYVLESTCQSIYEVSFRDYPSGVVSPLPDVYVKSKNGGSDFDVVFDGLGVGKAVVVPSVRNASIDPSDGFVRISVYHSRFLDLVEEVVGWLYFAAWSVSFYPQIYENWKRKSVVGLSFDFLSLNVVGFLLYSLFNIGLLWIPQIQTLYFSRHRLGINPVQLNDVIFSLHATFACVVTISQCFIYERGGQRISRPVLLLHAGIGTCLAVTICLSVASVTDWLQFLYVCSYIKLLITLVKYVPQAWLNYRRKSTDGWSIGNVLLDFSGGVLSIVQMIVVAYNYNDWSSIFGDPTKFGLGMFSVLFDVLFMIQHYVLYRNAAPHEELVNEDERASESSGEVASVEEEGFS